MTRIERFGHEFVEHIPDRPQERVLYISIPYATGMHLCACGCGPEVVTPLSPTDWEKFRGTCVHWAELDPVL